MAPEIEAQMAVGRAILAGLEDVNDRQ